MIRSSTSIKSRSVPSVDSPVVSAAVVWVTKTLHSPSATPNCDTHLCTRSVMSSTCLSRPVDIVIVVDGMLNQYQQRPVRGKFEGAQIALSHGAAVVILRL